MKTCSVRSKRRDQYQNDNHETNDKLNPLYTLSTMINVFHDKQHRVISWGATTEGGQKLLIQLIAEFKFSTHDNIDEKRF